jgi:hypothetical protein
VRLVREKLKVRRDETKSHQTYAGAKPRKKRPFSREVIPQIAYRLAFTGCIHFHLTRPLGWRVRGEHTAMPLMVIRTSGKHCPGEHSLYMTKQITAHEIVIRPKVHCLLAKRSRKIAVI